MKIVPVPVEWIEAVSRLRLPERADHRLQELMDRNTEGQLTPGERAEFGSLVEVSETLAPVRAGAIRLLGRTPL